MVRQEVLEKELDHPQQALDAHVGSQFFAHLTMQRIGGLLEQFTAPARQ